MSKATAGMFRLHARDDGYWYVTAGGSASGIGLGDNNVIEPGTPPGNLTSAKRGAEDRVRTLCREALAALGDSDV